MMIAAATAAAPPASNGMPFDWFDVFVLAMLLFGLFRGRRNGMTREIIPLLKWLVLVPLCGLAYPKLAVLLAGFIPDTLWDCLIGYLAPAMVVFIVFSMLKHRFAEKLVKSDYFKGGEYYLGMMSGLIRYACVLIFLLALLNAPVYSPADIAQMKAYDEKNFGGGLFAGNYFPHVFQIQDSVFKDSFLGPHIKDYAGRLLINTDESGAAAAQPAKNTAPAKPKPIIIIGGQIQSNPPAPAK